MADQLFATADGRPVTAVTAEEMRAVDRLPDEEAQVVVLAGLSCRLFLADIGIPRVVYERLDIPYESVFDGEYLVELLEA